MKPKAPFRGALLDLRSVHLVPVGQEGPVAATKSPSGPVRPSADGVVNLRARDARLHGPSLVYDQQHDCLGWWTNPDATASWQVAAEKDERFTLWIQYSCPPEAAGNQ